jgi:hypothetical protein
LIEEAVVTASSTSRGRARGLAGSALVAGVTVLLALTGCGAGQLAQTAREQSAISGVNGEAGTGGSIALRNALIPFNGTQGYALGGTAPIAISIFNNGLSPVKLVDVTAEDATDVVLIGGPAAPQPIPSPTTTAPSPAGSPAPSGSPTASPSPSPSPTKAAPAGQTSFSIPISAGNYALLTPDSGTYLQLVGLKKALAPGEQSTVVFKFDDGSSASMTLPVGPATGTVPRPGPVVSPGE